MPSSNLGRTTNHSQFKTIGGIIMERVNYIWITWNSETTSSSSVLWYNGDCSITAARNCIDNSDFTGLRSAKPFWMKNCVSVRMSAQNIRTSHILYSKTVEF